MENVTFTIDEIHGQEHAIIEHADGSFTSMLKSTYDEQQAQAEHFTPIVTSDE
jgi:hypothetical protein